MRTFRVLSGNHYHRDKKRPACAGEKYAAGDIIETEEDLAAKYGSGKFEEVKKLTKRDKAALDIRRASQRKKEAARKKRLVGKA